MDQNENKFWDWATFKDLNGQDIIDAIAFDHTDFSNEELLELAEFKPDEEDEDQVAQKPTKLTATLLNQIIENFQYACDFSKENDPFEERSSKIVSDIQVGIKSYIDESKENLKIQYKQQNINDFCTLPQKKPDSEEKEQEQESNSEDLEEGACGQNALDDSDMNLHYSDMSDSD